MVGNGSAERPGAVKGAPEGAAQRTLEGEDRSERIDQEGKVRTGISSMVSETRTSKTGYRFLSVSSMVLSETLGL